MTDRMLVPGLVRLALRRGLPGALCVFAAIVLLVALSSARIGVVPPGDEGLARAFARQSVFAAAALLVLPAILARAAGTIEGWRHRDADWLGARPVRRGAALLSTWLGTWLAGALLLLVTALAAEAAAGSSGPALRWSARLAHPASLLTPGKPTARWSLRLPRDVPAGAVLRLSPTVALGSGPAVSLRAAVRFDERQAEESARVFGPSELDVTLPRVARGTLELRLERIGEGAVAVLPEDSLELLVPGSDERTASLVLVLHALLALASGCALALGLGAWLRPALALGALAALFLGSSWAGELLGGWLPGADLVRSWALVGRGLVPPTPGVSALAGGLVAAALGLGLARAGIGDWRSRP